MDTKNAKNNNRPSFLEKLMLRVVDGEATALESVVLKVASKMNPAVSSRLEDFQKVNRHLSTLKPERVSVDLWSQVERRIDEEERSAAFLGQRAAREAQAEERESFIKHIFNPSLFGGMAVGLATAGVAFVIFNGGISSGDSTEVASNTDSAAEEIASAEHNTAQGIANFVSYGGSAAAKRREQTYEAYRNQRQVREIRRMDKSLPFEVDWMRSDGHVSFIQDPRRGSTVIWVKRGAENPNRPQLLEADPNLVEATR